MLRRLLPALQAVITLLLLAWIFSNPRLRAESAALWRQADAGWMLLGFLLAGATELACLLRWWCCLHLAGLPVRLPRAAALHFAGRFATLFLPGTAGGDAVKIAWLAIEFPQRRIGGVLATLMDRLSGFVALVVITGAVAALRYDWFQRTPLTASLLRGVLLLLGIALSGLLLWSLTSHPRLRDRHPRWLPMRAHILEISGIFSAFFADRRRAGAAVALSFAGLAAFFGIYACTARAFGASVSFVDLCSIMPVVDVVTMLPITISGLGLREKMFETLLGALAGTPASQAVLISLGGFGLECCWALAGAPVFLFSRSSRAPAAAHI